MSEHPRFGTAPPFGNDVHVTPVTLDDVAEVRALQRASFQSLQARHATDAEIAAFHAFLASDGFSNELAASIRQRNLIGAFLDGRLVGAAAWATHREDRRTARIRFLAVSPVFSGCGIGRRLLVEIEHAAKQVNCEAASARSLIGSTAFFERNGYVITSYGVYPLVAGESLAICYLRKSLVKLNA